MIDTGSKTNIMDEHTTNSLNWTKKIRPASTKAFGYNQHSQIDLIGELDTPIEWSNHTMMAKFLVTKGNGGSMLGYQTVIKLGIIQMNHKITLSKPPPINATDTFFDTLKSEYPKVFSGKIGKLKNFKLKLHMDKSVKPASHKHRFTPYYLRDPIKRELERLQNQDIIEPVLEPGEPTACYHKSYQSKIRRTHKNLHRLHNRQHLNQKNFHKLIQRTLAGINSQINVHDDILIFSETISSISTTLNPVLKRLDDNNLTVNNKKCEFNKEEIEFFGLKFNKNGVSPNEIKTKAFLDAKAPENKSQLHSFLGLSVYCSRFIGNNYATTAAPLRG